MKRMSENSLRILVRFVLSLLTVTLLSSPCLGAFTISVTGRDGSVTPAVEQTVTNFKWVVQEDNTYDSAAHRGIFNNLSSISVSIHKSYAKVLATGTGASPVFDPASNPAHKRSATGRYFVSVLAPGYTLSGGEVREGESQARILVHKNPIKTAQISVQVFHDNNPINGAPDAEDLLSGFQLVLYDQFGQQTQDAFGNPLGTIYNDDGSVKHAGTGTILTSPVTGRVVLPSDVPQCTPTTPATVACYDMLQAGFKLSKPIPGFVGNALIQNIPPGKYGVRAVPTDGRPWIQTSTIEGTPGIDNWVTAGSPPYYTEAGFFGVHTFIGFVLSTDYKEKLPVGDPYRNTNLFPHQTSPPGPLPAATGTLTGQVVQNRINRPPQQMGVNPGTPVPKAIIGLSDFGATQQQLFVLKCPGVTADGSSCDANDNFVIKNIPPGTYTLTMWDEPLDQIIDFRTFTIPATGGTVALGPTPVFQWFGVYTGSIFLDSNMNGVKDPGEVGLAQQAVGLRFRDGAPYMATVTDSAGEFALTEVFPFFKWLVAESDYGRFFPTGATVYVDRGGATLFDPNNPASLLEKRTDSSFFTKPDGTFGYSPFLLEGMILYFDEFAKIDWGRVPYPVTIPGTDTVITNGGISGVISYGFTRAPSDPRLGKQNTWEPGVPNVKLRLWKPTGFDANGQPLFAPPFDQPIAETVSDSWDRFVFEEANAKSTIRNKGSHKNTGLLTGCLDTMEDAGLSLTPQGIPLSSYIDCAETISVWNQIKPAVFDGGYIFTEYTDPVDGKTKPLPAGQYVVEVIPPDGHEIVKEEDQNYTVSGDSFIPSTPQPQAIPPSCIGPLHTVPQKLSYCSDDPACPDAPFAGQVRPLCTMKLVDLRDGQNAVSDFQVFTQVPLAGRFIGLVTDDLALEFRPGNPRLGDKPGPSFMPISIQDFAGHELVRTYTDEWGIYNTLLPSTYTTNVPNPTGVSPHMVKLFLNHPGFDPANPDPFYNPAYPVAEWTLDVWPGKITYVDTPIIPIRPNIGSATPDCNLRNSTPVISQVNGPLGGPWVANPADTAANTIIITSQGTALVANPDGNVGGTIVRDYGFGNTRGSITLNGTQIPVENILSWTNTTITVKLPTTAVTGQLEITRGDNYRTTVTGITLHVGVPAAQVKRVPLQYPTIQEAVDAAAPGDLILIEPGHYAENVIMYKPVKLQGYGAASTFVNAGFFTPEKQITWQAKLTAIFGAEPTSRTYSPDPVNNNIPVFADDAGAGILVLGRHDRTAEMAAHAGLGGDPQEAVPAIFTSDDFNLSPSRIDGLQITGANLGSGIFVNAYAHNLKISNVRLISNQGLYGGGIRLGTPAVVAPVPAPPQVAGAYLSSFNLDVSIDHSEVTGNGGTGLALSSGGGIGIYEGSDNYTVSDSWICGNYSMLAGAGIAQQGLSNDNALNPDGSKKLGVITRNTIIFNEAFDEGAGIFIGGEAPANPALANAVTPGAGNVLINGNLIQGNKGGNLGGGIGILRHNGDDVAAAPADPTQWYRVKIYNNIINNNISGGYGGGIAIFDAVAVDVVYNTIANNDTTATGELAFGNVPFTEGPFALINRITTPTPAGIGLQPVSATLLGKMDATVRGGYQDYSAAPRIDSNIITGNFSRYWANTGVNQIAALTPYVYWDLGIFGSTTGQLRPKNTLLSGATDTDLLPDFRDRIKVDQILDDGSNVFGPPHFQTQYRNAISAFQGGATLGNFIAFSYTPMTPVGDYHIKDSSAAKGKGSLAPAGVDPVDLGNGGVLRSDYDGDPRPFRAAAIPYSGADEFNTKGDVNADGAITLADALLALREMVKDPAQQSPAVIYDADVAPPLNGRPKGDGVLTIADVLMILQRATGVLIW